MINHETQTGPDLQAGAGGQLQRTQAKQSLATSQHADPQKQPVAQSVPKKSRRRTGKEYLIAARNRREQQKWRNENHPTPKEEQWTCEFCEYEQIFGTPPIALIKQYEIKDRHARKQEAERRRLLEKAKMKGRKGKKGGKAAVAKTAPAAQDRQAQPSSHQAPMSQNHSQSQGTQSEECFEDEYDDEYAQEDPLSSPTEPYSRRNQPIETDVRKDSLHGNENIQVPAS